MCPLPKCKKTEFLQNSDWIWVYKKCTQFWGNMFVTHTIINVKYSGNQRDMKYFCDSNIFGFISNYFWHLHFWTYCRWFDKSLKFNQITSPVVNHWVESISIKRLQSIQTFIGSICFSWSLPPRCSGQLSNDGSHL